MIRYEHIIDICNLAEKHHVSVESVCALCAFEEFENGSNWQKILENVDRHLAQRRSMEELMKKTNETVWHDYSVEKPKKTGKYLVINKKSGVVSIRYFRKEMEEAIGDGFSNDGVYLYENDKNKYKYWTEIPKLPKEFQNRDPISTEYYKNRIEELEIKVRELEARERRRIEEEAEKEHEKEASI